METVIHVTGAGVVSAVGCGQGETSAYVLERFDPETFVALVEQAFQDSVTASALCGWVDARADDDFTAFAFLVERDGTGMELNKETIYGTVNQ